MTTNDSTDPVQNLARLIDAIDFAMLTTTSTIDGQLESRPMATQQEAFSDALWFLALRSSHLVACIEQHSQVNISYTNPARQRYVSVTGSATVVDNHARRHAFWRPSFTAWFPGGVDTPDLVLLRVRVDHADYWEDASRVVVRLVGFAQTILGRDHEDLTSSHGRIVL